MSGTIKYSDYGAVTSQTGIVSTFKYAGQHGAITDSNGLVYLQTRYYNPQLMRFMNRDTVSGSITDTQSMNRFSYVQGNPLTYVDLNGQARTWLKDNGQNLFLYTELALAGIGMIPIASDVTNILLFGMDMAVGDYAGMALDAVGLIPFANDASNSARLALIGAKLGRRASQAEKLNVAEKVVKSEKTVKYEVALRPKYEVAVIRDKNGIPVRRPEFLKQNREIDWDKFTPNGGAIEKEDIPLKSYKGDKINRIGSERGVYGTDVGTDSSKLSLPYSEDYIASNKHTYVNISDEPLELGKSTVAPGFGEPGMGNQYRFKQLDPNSIYEYSSFEYLIRTGKLKEVK